MNDPYVIDYIKKHFPNHKTQSVADHLQLTVSQVRTIAKNHRIQKCEEYKANLKRQLIIDRKKWFEDNIPALNPTFLQEQIIFDSVIGDRYISRGVDRSVNCYYQKHFGENERGYRERKLSHLQDLQFTIKGNYLRSSSHPYYNSLHQQLYKNNINQSILHF
ncbi:hypothetical protein [Pseudogracilibacillus sp. SO10305]|uniref:hypothetical protein n=1 Tax=Pseudogracilibacillus sp. SO10305 TaxID=3098292 RepID=UPI00300DE40D